MKIDFDMRQENCYSEVIRLKTLIKFFLDTKIWIIPYLWTSMEVIL